MVDLDEVLKSALSLTVEERATLAERLLLSLDELSEVERRPSPPRRFREGPTALAVSSVRYLEAAKRSGGWRGEDLAAAGRGPGLQVRDAGDA